MAGLEGGADDWMTQPFRFEELLARIRLRLRTAARAPEVTVLRSGDLSLDLRTRRARAGDRTVDLTAREFVLLEPFLRHPGQVLSRERILSPVRGYGFDPGSNGPPCSYGTRARPPTSVRLRGAGPPAASARDSPRPAPGCSPASRCCSTTSTWTSGRPRAHGVPVLAPAGTLGQGAHGVRAAGVDAYGSILPAPWA